MDLHEVEHRSQMRCLVALEQSSPVSTLLRTVETAVPCFIYREKGQILINLYFQNDGIEYNEVSQILKYPQTISKGHYSVLKESVSSVAEMQIIDEILHVPSVILGQTYLYRGQLHLGFRFHKKYSREISAILAKFVGHELRGKVLDLGPSFGVVTSVDLMNSMIPLSMVRYIIPASTLSESARLPPDMSDWISEIADSKVAEKKFKALVHIKGHTPDEISQWQGWNPIDINTYEASFFNRFMISVREDANSNLIPRYASIIKPDGRNESNEVVNLEISVFLPSVAVETYTSGLFRLANEYFRDDLYITVIRKYNEQIWSFF